jgi:hypothetical protein
VAHIDSVSTDRLYMLLGPFPVRTVVKTLRVALSSAGAAAIQVTYVAATIGSGREASQVGLDAGRSLIQRSNISTLGPPTISFGFATTGGERRLVVPVGVRVKGGPVSIVVAFLCSLGVPNTGVIGSVSTLQWVGPGRDGDQGEEAG